MRRPEMEDLSWRLRVVAFCDGRCHWLRLLRQRRAPTMNYQVDKENVVQTTQAGLQEWRVGRAYGGDSSVRGTSRVQIS